MTLTCFHFENSLISKKIFRYLSIVEDEQPRMLKSAF